MRELPHIEACLGCLAPFFTLLQLSRKELPDRCHLVIKTDLSSDESS